MAVWISGLSRGPIFTFKYSPNLRGLTKRNSKITKVVNRHTHKEISIAEIMTRQKLNVLRLHTVLQIFIETRYQKSYTSSKYSIFLFPMYQFFFNFCEENTQVNTKCLILIKRQSLSHSVCWSVPNYIAPVS